MARKGILNPNIAKTPPAPQRAARTPAGSVGALQSSLSRLQENAVIEVDPDLIDAAGIEDRLSQDPDAMRRLRDSLETYGQQVPVLLRPHADKPGRYQIVYGRRRWAALRDLGLPVKAMVRSLDDHALVLAQGQENTARQDLSFIEKASFAAQLDASGYDRKTIGDALSIDLPMVSRYLKVGTAFDLAFLRQIGAAPAIGRDRWLALVKLCEDQTARSRAATFMARPEFAQMDSNARFEAVFAKAKGKATPPAPPPAPQALRGHDGTVVADLKRSRKALSLNIAAKDGFDIWFEENAAQLIADLHQKFLDTDKE